jgi:hypothetical protein
MTTIKRTESTSIRTMTTEQATSTTVPTSKRTVAMTMSTQATKEVPIVAEAIVLKAEDAAATRVAASRITTAATIRSRDWARFRSATAFRWQSVGARTATSCLREIEHPQAV